ncbi:MAG: VCBS repeat-containing protein [Planctomycetes bacterium]|nr:VCBS repeat-containing protein [Planctomycetota bacterium]
MKYSWMSLAILVTTGSAWAAEPGELLPPVPIQVNGRPLDVERDGHAAPFVGDFDGDGARDLLVGQFHEGRLRIYRNMGTNREPKFTSYTWFEAGGMPGRVPEG